MGYIEKAFKRDGKFRDVKKWLINYYKQKKFNFYKLYLNYKFIL